MALISCSECGKEVSDTALTCPGCGATINLVEKTKGLLKWSFKITAAVWGIMAIIALVITVTVLSLT